MLNYLESIINLILLNILFLPIFLDNLAISECENVYWARPNTYIRENFEAVIHLINDWIKSVAGDEGHHEVGLLCIFIFWIPSLINTSIAVCPFINENSECDTLLLFSDIMFVGLGFLLIIIPVLGYYTVTASITWTIPIVFNLFLPAIEILGKIVRSANLALRLSSNLTAGHLLMLLIAAFGEFLLTSIIISFKFIGLIILNFSAIIILLESFLICIQSYVWSILILYYLNQDE